MHLDADVEMEEIDAEVRHVPEVLAVRVQVYRALEKWELMQVVARRLAQYDPDDVEATRAWAYATRRAECIEAARLILLDAVERLPHVARLHYDLAGLECQLGEVEVANGRLQHALKLDPALRLAALDDPDLAAVWE
jgi:hypothetical protein